VQMPQRFGETVSRVWGGTGSPRRCVLKGEAQKLWIDVVEVRVIAAHFEQGCLVPAHGTLTVGVGSDDASAALQDLARSREAVVLERPDGAELEMRLGGLSTTNPAPLDGAPPVRSTVTYSWHSP
jgi:hypothetical protein